jgi:hypothetical protein
MKELLESQLIRVIVWITLACLVLVIVFELYGKNIYEGFQTKDETIGVGKSNFWAKLVPRRGDVGPELEVGGLTRNSKYFAGYADMQRFGAKTDFCRMVRQGDDEKDTFFACALGGSENTSSIAFKTISVREGFQLSRDDYMRDTNGDGREDYCRILKQDTGFEALCNLSKDWGFENDLVMDPDPPSEIAKLLEFYAGAMVWLRFYDDMLDYTGNLIVKTGGEAEVIEDPPRPEKTKGLILNGVDQFVRIGDDRKMRLGSTVLLRQMRGVCFWVKFSEFTNNAKVFDFGNGAGNDNVFVGIVGKGNQGLDVKQKPSICGGDNSTLPQGPSGAQPAWEVHPQVLMATTSANCDKYDCQDNAVEPILPKKEEKVESEETADMIYEVWEKKVRKMHLVVQKAFKLGTWTHVCITNGNNNAFRPDIHIYINGVLAFVQPSGWMPQVSNVATNYIGKSNWANATSQYADRDELLKGALFDFRMYNTRLSERFVKETVDWGRQKLGLDTLESKEDQALKEMEKKENEKKMMNEMNTEMKTMEKRILELEKNDKNIQNAKAKEANMRKMKELETMMKTMDTKMKELSKKIL